MNISDKMRELIFALGSQFNGVDIEPLQEECQDEWCEDYAIAYGLHFEPIWDDEYFDYDKFKGDILEHIKGHFGHNAMLIEGRNSPPYELPDDQIVIHFNEHCGEIEVYRMKHARKFKDD